jgi:hypothetical protein
MDVRINGKHSIKQLPVIKIKLAVHFSVSNSVIPMAEHQPHLGAVKKIQIPRHCSVFS